MHTGEGVEAIQHNAMDMHMDMDMNMHMHMDMWQVAALKKTSVGTGAKEANAVDARKMTAEAQPAASRATDAEPKSEAAIATAEAAERDVAEAKEAEEGIAVDVRAGVAPYTHAYIATYPGSLGGIDSLHRSSLDGMYGSLHRSIRILTGDRLWFDAAKNVIIIFKEGDEHPGAGFNTGAGGMNT